MQRASTAPAGQRTRRVASLEGLALLAVTLLCVGAPMGRAEAAGVPRETYELMQRIAAPIRRCYAQELQHDPGYTAPDPVPGVRVVIPRRGDLRLELVDGTGSARLDRCLRSALRRLRLARTQRPVREQYSVLFMPDGEPRVLRIR